MDSESEIDDADIVCVRTKPVLAETESEDDNDVFVPTGLDSETDDDALQLTQLRFLQRSYDHTMQFRFRSPKVLRRAPRWGITEISTKSMV